MKTDMKVITIPDFIIFLKAIGNNVDRSMSDICFDTKITYSHLHKLKKTFILKQWITINKNGQRHIPMLTGKGLNLLKASNVLLEELDITDVDILNFRGKQKIGPKDAEKIETKPNEFYDTLKEKILEDKPVTVVFDEAPVLRQPGEVRPSFPPSKDKIVKEDEEPKPKTFDDAVRTARDKIFEDKSEEEIFLEDDEIYLEDDEED